VNRPLVDLLSELMASPKAIAGTPTWQTTARDGQFRWLAALAIDGAVSKAVLVVDAYPRSELLRFTISLICGTALARLDYWEMDRHLNHIVSGLVTPAGVELRWLDGPHFHGWPQNSGLVKNEPPRELEFAVPLPASIQGFANAFRWFCAENAIELGNREPPDLPAKDVLL
jgi:hypothetical protein